MPSQGQSRRLGITGVPGVGKSTFIDALGMHLVRARNERVAVLSVASIEPHLGRQHPRRQDTHGAAGARAARVHPPLARAGTPRRRRSPHARGHPAVRGRGLRERARRNRGRGPVRDGGPVDDRLLPAADARWRRRRAAGHQARDHRDGRRHGRHQGGRRQSPRRRARARRVQGRAPPLPGARRRMDAARADVLGAGRRGDRGGVGDGAGTPRPAHVERAPGAAETRSRPASGCTS